MSNTDITTLSKKIENISKEYAAKFNIERDGNWYILKLQEELGELIQAYLIMTGKARSKGKSESEIREDFEKESADVLCHALLLMEYYKIDVEKVINDKWLVWLDEKETKTK